MPLIEGGEGTPESRWLPWLSRRRSLSMCASGGGFDLEQRCLPQDFPFEQAPCASIVLSKIGHFLEAQDLRMLATLCRDAPAPAEGIR